MKKVLHIFKHGLGDAIQFTSVLKHLRDAYDWEQSVAALKGKHSAFHGIADQVYCLDTWQPDRSKYDAVYEYDWPENYEVKPHCPSTKAVKCLQDVFGFGPVIEFLPYWIHVRPEAREKAEVYISSLPARPFVCLHYEGNTSTHNKNLSHETAKGVCDYLVANGLTVVLLDWDRRSPLPNNETIFCPDEKHPMWMGYGTGDAETLAALVSKAAACVMIDSGPQKVCWAMGVPNVSVWTGHHPRHYCDRAENTIHLVPNGMAMDGYAAKAYPHVHYAPEGIVGAICNQVGKLLNLPVMPMPDLRSTAYDEAYYQEHKQAGLDYLAHGSWQEDYGRWVVGALWLTDQKVLDVGCACGSIAAGLAKAGALVSGCDTSEYMIQLGRERWLRENLKVCDAVNLHYWGDDTFDCIHSNQVFEHFKPRAVPLILEELYRVTKPGGYLFVVLDTEELFSRQKRGANEDPTHICVKPMAWWHDRLAEAGWKLRPDLMDRVKLFPGSYFQSYDWDAFVAQKPEE